MFPLGDYNTSETVNIPFNSFSSNDPSASVTITNLAAGDIEIHKDGSITQRASDNGVTVSVDFDGVPGNHMIHIDLSDNSDDGFYAVGSRYEVRIEGTTIDAGTVNAWVGAFSIGTILRPTTAGRTLAVSATGEADADVVKISNDSTAADNLELQYDTTGLTGDTFPARQDQVSQIGSGGGSANNEFAILSPNGFVITDGENEVNNEDATRAIGGDVHSIDEVNATGVLDVYYLHDIGGAFSPNTIVFTGRMNGINQNVGVYVNTNTQASPTWVQRATLLGQALTSNAEHVWKLENADQMVGADAGKVAVRFQATGLSNATLTTDQIVVEKTTIASLVGYSNGAIWFDDTAGNANTVINVDGVADNPVSTWAAVKTLIASTGLRIVDVANGSTITLDANSDGLSLTGETWTLELGGQSIVHMHVRGATVSGTSTGSGSDFHDCDMGTCTIGPCNIIDSRFTSKTGGGFTMQTAGDYTFHKCGSMVPGNDSPVFTFPGAGDTFISDRSGSGGRQYEGMSAGDLASVEGWGQFIEGTCSGGAVTIRGCLTTSGITNITVTDEARFDVAQITGGAYSLDTDNNGRIRIVDGTNAGEINTNNGAIVLVETTTVASNMRGTDDGPTLLVDTTASAVPSSTLITLAAGSDQDNAYQFQDVVIRDVNNSNFSSVRRCIAYAGSTKIISLESAPNFTVEIGDRVTVQVSRGTEGANKTAPNTVVPDVAGTAATLLGTGGANLGDLGGMSTAMKAEARVEAAGALVAIHLDHIFAVDYDPASKPGVATALFNELIESNAGVSRYTVGALAQAPSGSGGDATEAKQDAIIATLGVAGAGLTAAIGADSDTHKTLSDQIDGIVGGTGTGARTVAVTVNDGAAVLENASVRFTEGANTYAGPTDASGEISFSLDDATYAVAVSKPGYTFTPTTLVVDGDKTPTYSMTAISITAPPNAATTTGVMTVYDEEGSVEEGVTVTVQIIDGPGTDGIGYDSTEWAELSSALGVVEFAGIILGARYKIWRGTSKPKAEEFTAPTTGTSFDLAEVIGRG